MKMDSPQLWTVEMVAQFRDCCFPKYDNPQCHFDIFEKNVYVRIEDAQDASVSVGRSTNITYSCHLFAGPVLQGVPFYLVLSEETDYYKESGIGYLQIVNGQNRFDEPQAKILAHIRQGLNIESSLDEVISDANSPPGFKKVIILRLDSHERDRWNGMESLGIKLPIRELEIEYTQGQSKETWSAQ